MKAHHKDTKARSKIRLCLISVSLCLCGAISSCATSPALDPRDPAILHQPTPAAYPAPR
jgi:hypothetical protein